MTWEPESRPGLVTQEGRAEVTETPTETPVFGQVEAETLSLGPSGPGAKTNRGLGEVEGEEEQQLFQE